VTERVLLDGKPIADPSYAAGEVAGVTFPGGASNPGNGASLTNVLRNAAGASTGVTWAFPNVQDAVVRSQSGRIVANTITDGSDRGEHDHGRVGVRDDRVRVRHCRPVVVGDGRDRHTAQDGYGGRQDIPPNPSTRRGRAMGNMFRGPIAVQIG
jgi:hypothetical protein